MSKKNILKYALASVGAMSLAACSGGGEVGSQDVGTGEQSRVFSARVIDGYLAGATVYVDQNENGKLDAFEPRALTDADGFFSYNHITGVDYCAANASASDAAHCLRGAIASNASVLIRTNGGYDTITGLPFEGALSLRSSDLDRNDLRLVTPQTSMLADGSSTQEKLDALIQAGLLPPSGSLDDDPYEGALGGPALRAQLATILARITGEAAELATQGFPSFSDVESGAWTTAYIEAAKKMQLVDGRGNGTFGEKFATTADVQELLRRAVHQYLNPNQPMPADYTLPNEAAAAPLLASVPYLAQLSEMLAGRMESDVATLREIIAAQRLMAITAERMIRNPLDPEIADAMAWAVNQLAQADRLGSDLTQLGDDDIDPSVLVDPDFDFDPVSNTISASAKIPPEAAMAFAALANTSFGIEVNKYDEQGAALLYIGGDSGARTGNLDVCVRFRDNSGDFDTGSPGDPDGAMLISGRWGLLNDHSLVLNIDVAGGVRSMLLKSVGVNGLDREYRFNFGSEFSGWSGSAPAPLAPSSVPTSDAACRTALIDAFGSVSAS